MSKWDLRFLKLAEEVASWSKDPRTQVGCVITHNRKVISTGYNGFPKGLSDDLDLYLNPKYKRSHVIHAEHNAILNSVVPPAGSTLYSNFAPCVNCTLVIIQSGVRRVVTWQPPQTHWLVQQEEAKELMESVGIIVDWIDAD